MAQVLAYFEAPHIFGVGGDFVANIISALEHHLPVIAGSNEMHAGFSACAQAEISGIGFCLTTYTVGSLPCLSAAALARTEGLPVVFISGAPGEGEVGRMALHHSVCHGGSWDLDHDAALRAFGGLNIRAERLQGPRHPGQPSVAGEHFFELVRHAFRERAPVFIEVPRDLVNLPTQTLSLPPRSRLAEDELLLDGTELLATEVQRKLKQARSPLVFVGERIRLNRALRQHIESFCQEHGIPYATNWFGKGVFDENDPLFLGSYNGVFSQPDARDYIERQADYILELGTSILPQDTPTAFGTGTYHVEHFDNKTVIKGTSRCDADLSAFMNALSALDLPHFQCAPKAPARRVPEAGDALGFHNLAATLNAIQDRHETDFIYLPEVGNSFFASFGLRPRKNALGRAWLSNPWYAAMGTTLPYARAVAETLRAHSIGGCLPVMIVGDGGFHFQQNELIHFLKQDLDAILILMRNELFHLGKSSDAPIYYCSDERFDAMALVQAFGGRGWQCSNVEQLQTRFQEYLSGERRGLALIEIPVDTHDQHQSPEIRLLNIYIKSRNGDPEAMREWERLTRPGASRGSAE
ncbi:thiamine pyrophosphate-binding protein [Wenzhouxiangella sp. AB-CW3]|nr:thiamine pyrophosphate-binding protein [Wenzhouxiangella sp. AB-CW3]